MKARKQDMEKARYWKGLIHQAARSGLSNREFCRQRKLHEAQFYWWQRKLAATRHPRNGSTPVPAAASFALVSEEPGMADAGIELVLSGGRRLRIARGVDEQTLRAVLTAIDAGAC
jgi:hypothetical protein